MSERDQLERAIVYIESQRAVMGDDVADTSIAALRARLAALPSTVVPDAQRRQATVLFVDVSGFTALSERMDAEEVSDLINDLWQRLDQAILDHGGRIDKHLGDGLMALWGAEAAREDDPERAIRAALAIQERVAALNAEARHAVPLQVHAGIHTGLVLLGEVGTTGEYTALGDTVNLASRLGEAAPAGGTLISHDTFRLVRGVFEVHPQGPLQLRGKREATAVYLVRRARQRAFRMGTRGVEGIETQMIGREAELGRLQEALGAAVAGRLQWVTIWSDAGLGKSRLLHEFEKWVDLQPMLVCYFKGRAGLEMQGHPYALLRDLLAFRFQIQESDPVQAVWQKMEAGVAEAWGVGPGEAPEPARQQAHWIGQLVGYDFCHSPYLQGVVRQGEVVDARQLRDRALACLRDYTRARARLHPLLILLEDLQWADDSSLDLIEQLIQGLDDQRILVVGAARPALRERRPRWGEGGLEIQLGPLSPRDSQQLVEEILQRVEQVPEPLRELVTGGAEGNPFYIEELIKMLIEDGVIVKGEERWRVELARLNPARIPPTLVGVLQSRLDSLPPEERTILQRASVVGRTFWDRAVASISSAVEGLEEEAVADLLQALRQREMVYGRPTSLFADSREYIFRHAILREVTYESVLKRVRRVYHGLVAEWLIEHSGERVEEYTGLIADHLELAGQAQRAVSYLRRAGEQAAARFANAEAVGFFGRALGLLPAEALAERYDLLLAREGIHSLRGDRPAQQADLDALDTLAGRLDAAAPGDESARLRGAGRRAEVAWRRGSFAEETGDYPAAMAGIEEAIRLAGEALARPADGATAGTAGYSAARLEVARVEAMGFLLWGRVLWRQGEYEAAQPQLQRALERAQAILGGQVVAEVPPATARLVHGVESDSLRGLGNVCWYCGDYEAAQGYYERALQICRQQGNRRGESASLNNLGTVCAKMGQQAEAEAYYEQSMAIDREIGSVLGVSKSLGNLGSIKSDRGYYAEARACFEESLRMCREIGDVQGLAGTLNNLGLVHDQLGNYAAARDCFEQALAIRRRIGAQQGQGEGLSDLAMLHHHMGDDEAALEYSRQSLAIMQKLGDPFIEGFVWQRMGHALAGLGRLDEAEASYNRALELRRQGGLSNVLLETLAGLARVALARGAAGRARELVEQIVPHLAPGQLEGAEEPFRIYLTCYQVLRALGDPRAIEVLQAGRAMLQEWAGHLPDEALRRSFLEGVRVHREIVAAMGEAR